MENNNLLVSIILSIGIMVGFHYFYEVPHQTAARQEMLAEQVAKETPLDHAADLKTTRRDRKAVIAETKRITIETEEVRGSINLKGARIDDLLLSNYLTTAEQNASPVTLLSPAGSAEPNHPYYAEFGWLGENINVPDATTEWKADTKTLTTAKPVHLTWDNGQGLTFERTVAIDNHFMFTVTDRVKNTSSSSITLYPFGLVARHGANKTTDLEGPLGVFNGTLIEEKFTDIVSDKKKGMESTGGWLGMGDKYWLVALVPPQNDHMVATFTYENDPKETNSDNIQGLFQTDYRGSPVTIANNGTAEHTQHLFAGAKRVRLFETYADQFQLPNFDRAIDFGWFYFLTKPFIYLLDYLGQLCGNYGLGILVLTVLLKLVTYPLSAKSYRSMAKMKEIQPEIKRLQDRYKDDQQRLAIETMELYKREKTNPMSGCLPMLIQMPVFFALFKVLSVNIELRHAPFYGWIHDLSAPDPTSVLTLFGLIPFDIPLLPHLGIWPLLMGISMYLQQILSPQPPDANQARMLRFMPILFTFMMAQAASGLVIYWTIGNILGLIQQWAIMHQHGDIKK